MDDNIRGTAAVISVASLGAPLLITSVLFALRARSLRRQAVNERASLETNPFTLRPGPVSLAGSVEPLDGEDDAPVKVSVAGGERRIDARPFLLHLANGVRVRVEPGERPLLRDELEAGVARLTAGERVFVRGVLKAPIEEGPYAERSVIGAPRWGRVLLSTAAFSGELERRSRALGFQIFMLFASLGLTQLLYVKLWIDALSYWVGGGERPYIFGQAFFWVSIVVFSVLLGSVWSAWEERPWHAR